MYIYIYVVYCCLSTVVSLFPPPLSPAPPMLTSCVNTSLWSIYPKVGKHDSPVPWLVYGGCGLGAPASVRHLCENPHCGKFAS